MPCSSPARGEARPHYPWWWHPPLAPRDSQHFPDPFSPLVLCQLVAMAPMPPLHTAAWQEDRAVTAANHQGVCFLWAGNPSWSMWEWELAAVWSVKCQLLYGRYQMLTNISHSTGPIVCMPPTHTLLSKPTLNQVSRNQIGWHQHFSHSKHWDGSEDRDRRWHEIYSVTTKFECFDVTWQIIIVSPS